VLLLLLLLPLLLPAALRSESQQDAHALNTLV
jgi:hypothetical protein